MLTINLRRADGAVSPYGLQIWRSDAENFLEVRVVASDKRTVVASSRLHQDKIPLTQHHDDVEGPTMILGHEPVHEQVLVEFGPEHRLAMAPVGEVRSALGVCLWHDRMA